MEPGPHPPPGSAAALDLASGAGGNPSGHEPLPPDEDRFDHYALVSRADGAFDAPGRGPMGVT
ncbi:MAG: hypothetical protein JO015_11475 [Verrucomicrobia bacterium]|nr:hypothetical protein [Verrucomicrobiota bacterium]